MKKKLDDKIEKGHVTHDLLHNHEKNRKGT